MLPTNAKLLFTYLITSPSSHLSGIYYLPLTTVSHETSLSQKETVEAFSLLADSDLVAYDDATNTVWVKNMLRHQGRGQKIIKSVEYQLASLHNSKLIKLFLEHYQGFIDRVSIPLRYPIEGGSVLSSPSPSPNSSSLSSLNLEEAARPPVDNSKLKPKKKTLDPRIKVAADRIYNPNPKRFRRLVVWIKEKEKYGFKPEWIVSALQEFELKMAGINGEWWPYLEQIGKRIRAKALQAESAKFKNEPVKLGAILDRAMGKKAGKISVDKI